MAGSLPKPVSTELAVNLELAKDAYLKDELTINQIAEAYSINPHTLRYYIYQGASAEKPWSLIKKEYRETLIRESTELSKVNLSHMTNAGADLLAKCFDRITRDLEKGNLATKELIDISRVLLTGLPKIYEVYAPSIKSPLVNIAMSQNDQKVKEDKVLEELSVFGFDITVEGNEQSTEKTA